MAPPGHAVAVPGRSRPTGGGIVTWTPPEVATSEYALKRPLDLLLSGIGLTLAAPIFAAVALAIKLEDRGPVFYTQERVGRNGARFKLMKFRSMVPDAEAKTGPVWAAREDPRITRVGRILRKTALDELPQLINIFRGDMRFVGPRSHRVFFYEKFRSVPGYTERYRIHPGLTGLAQVLARYDSSAEQKLRFDLLYARKQSFGLDTKLILASFLITFSGKWDERQGKKLGFVSAFLRRGAGRARSNGSRRNGHGRA